jgi:HK97 family phage major capsid protein
MPSIAELRTERGKLETRMREILDKAEAENRDLTEHEDGQFKETHNKAEEYRSRIERAEKLDALAKQNGELRCGDLTTRDLPAGSAVGTPPDASGNTERRTDADLALEGWALRSLGIGGVGEHHHAAARRQGLDLYQGHFDVELFGNRELRTARAGWERRDLTTTGAADVIPTDFIAQLERAIQSYGGVLAVASQVRTSGGNPQTYPTIEDFHEADDVDEAGNVAATEADPTFGKITFNAYKVSTGVRYSTELEEDAGFDLTGELSGLLGERIGRKLARGATNGSGTGEAQGIVTGSGVGRTTASDGAISSDDLLDLIHSVDPAYRNGARFLMHDQILLHLRKLKDGENRYIWQPDMQAGAPGTIHGYPLSFSQEMDSAQVTGAQPVLFGQLSKHRIRLVRGVRLVVARELHAGTDEIAMYAHLRYDSKVMQSRAIKHLRMGGGYS